MRSSKLGGETRPMKASLLALVVAVVAYLAWIPAVADNSHPFLATVAGLVCYGALIAFVVIVVSAVVRRLR